MVDKKIITEHQPEDRELVQGRNWAITKEVVNTNERILNLRSRSEDLNRSDFFRNQRSYEAFLDLIEKQDDSFLLIIGLGRLEEILGYLSTYYNQKTTFDWLDVTLMDVQEKEDFLDYAKNSETYSLGKNFLGTQRTPPSYTKDAFEEHISGVFVAKNIIKQKVEDLVQNNSYFTTAIDEKSEVLSTIAERKYDFISCNNVFQYVAEEKLEATIHRLIDLLNPNWIISCKTQEVTRMPLVIKYIKSHSAKWESFAKGIYKKVAKN